MISLRFPLLLLVFNLTYAYEALATTVDQSVSPPIFLTPDEDRYLAQKKEITFCVDPDWMPFEAIRGGQLDGMTPDYIDLFAKRLGVPFRLIPTTSWTQSQDWAKAGKCDILPMIPITKKSTKHLTFTGPYLSYSVGIIAANKLRFISSLADLEKLPVGIVKGYSTWEYVEQNFPDNTFVEVDGVEDGLLKVSSGENAAFLIAVPVAVHSIKELGLSNLKVSGHIEIKKELRIGISRQVPELAPIIKKLTASLSKEDVDGVYRKWVTLRFEHAFNYDLLWKVGAILLIVMTGVVLWNRKLRQLNKEIRERGEELLLSKEKTEKSEAQLHSTYHRTPVMLHSIDSQGLLLSVSDYWLKCMGYEMDEVIGQPSRDFLTPESAQFAHDVVLPKFFKQGHCESVEYQFVRKDGSIFDGCLSAVLERDESGNPTRTLAVTIDVTERNIAEAQLSTAKETAERADLAKTKFLATASHDIRQPLQAANLFLYALGTKEHTPESQEIISNIAASVESIDNLLNSLLDISRLEAGLVKPQIQAMPVANVIERLASEYVQIATDEKVQIKVVSSTAVVLTDPVLLESIIRNLLSNALKNARNGKILFGCRRHENSVSLEVWDNGSGIPEDRLTDIFTEFVQIGNEGRDRSKGLGLGLSIVEKLAGLLDHRIAVRSWEGKGSVFSVELPLVVEGEEADLVRESSTLALPAHMSAFIVEDEASVRISLSLVLEGQGYEVHAISGNDIQECKRMASNMAAPPDIILADFRLQGGGTGIEAINCLRETFNKNTPAVLLTGDTAPDRLAEAKSSGLPLLHKPIKADDLLLEIGKAIEAGDATSQNA